MVGASFLPSERERALLDAVARRGDVDRPWRWTQRLAVAGAIALGFSLIEQGQRDRRVTTMQPMLFDVRVEVRLRDGIADPQGATIERSLPTLGFAGVSGVRVGKLIRFVIEATDEAAARREIDDLCHRFLANPVIEDSQVTMSVAVPT